MPSHNDIAVHLNNSYFSELNSNMRNFINYISGGINESSDPLISCTVIRDNLCKPNLEIIINRIPYYVSVLDGQGNSVHEEKPEDIISFLEILDAPDGVIEFIDGLCYSELTTGGFLNSVRDAELRSTVRNFFHTNRRCLIERFLQTGIYDSQESEFVYYGNVNRGICLDIETVIERLVNSSANTNLIAIGGLVLQRKNRFVNNNIQIKWPNPYMNMISE